MYEDQTYEAILSRALARIPTNVDKREGSVIMNAVAPASAELANMYILLDNVIKNGYADTAIREYLLLRCRERGITPYEATKAVLLGQFNMEIPIGSRFNLDELNYKAIEFSEKVEDVYYYLMECETAGTEGNKYLGELSPIMYIHKDLKGLLVGVPIPAVDEESTEDLRERYINSFNTTAFGGNKHDYKEKVRAIGLVGGVIVEPAWMGGGTVRLVIIDNLYNKAHDELIKAVQDIIDPGSTGTGSGIAPVGHKVTVQAPEEFPISVSFKLTYNPTLTAEDKWAVVKPKAEEVIKAYLLEQRKLWEETEGKLTIRISDISSCVLALDEVMDIQDVAINGAEENWVIEPYYLPVFKEVINNG